MTPTTPCCNENGHNLIKGVLEACPCGKHERLTKEYWAKRREKFKAKYGREMRFEDMFQSLGHSIVQPKSDRMGNAIYSGQQT